MIMDVVCPVIKQDLARFEILVASLRKFWKVEGRIVAAVPRIEMPLFQHLNVEVLAQEDVIGVTPYERGVNGWYLQQMVKLGIADVLRSEAYMVIDADCFVAKELRTADIVRDGYLVRSEPKEDATRRPYFTGSWDALDLVTQETVPWSWRPPFFVWRDTVQWALRRLEERGMHWAEVLARSPRWADVCIYQAAAIEKGSPHICVPYFAHDPIRWPWVDIRADFNQWDVSETFSGAHMFGVVHSKTGIPAEQVALKLQDWIQVK